MSTLDAPFHLLLSNLSCTPEVLQVAVEGGLEIAADSLLQVSRMNEPKMNVIQFLLESGAVDVNKTESKISGKHKKNLFLLFLERTSALQSTIYFLIRPSWK